MNCVECGHTIDWHGDRAITACDGGFGLNRGEGGQIPVHRYAFKGSVCPCTGFKVKQAT